MKRVIAYLQGGLGNQCFIYAAARALALRAGATLSFNLDLFLEDRVYRRRLGIDSFVCDMTCLPVSGKVRRMIESLRSRLSGRFCAGWGDYRCDCRPYKYRPLPLVWEDALLLDGYWQSEKYFLDAKEQLLHDFRLKDGSWVVSDPLARQIRSEANSIFLHVRSYKEVPGKSDGRCAIDMRGYYRNALRYLRGRMGNGTVFVFSDDLGWSRRHVLTDDVLKDSPFNFVFDSANSSQLRDFTLMRMCKHGIVADSSFSWWAGWLGEQDRLSRGEEGLRLHVNRRVMNDDFWPDRWIAISPSSLG